MENPNKPTPWIGALVGGLLTAPLIAIFFLAAQLLGTPFAPFDVFDWVGRVMPGPIITFGIDTIVGVIRTFNLGETSSAAKTAEQFLALFGLVVTGVLVGAIAFAVQRSGEVKTRYALGVIAGLALGVPVMFISRAVNQNATASPLVSAVWIILAFVAWGVALNWVYYRLTEGQPGTVSTNEVQQLDRRNFLVKVGGATAAITVVGAGLGALLSQGGTQTAASGGETALAETPLDEVPWSETNALPNADATLTPAPGTRPEYTPLRDHYRIDINTLPPVIKESEWELPITGLVDNPVTLKLADIRENYTPMDQFVTLACISNPVAGDLIGTTRWTGVPLRDIIKDAKLQPEATHLRITAADDFDEVIDLETVMNDERVTLNYAWDGVPLETQHGFPLRIYIPNHYGMKQPKWITKIEAIPAWEEGYWVRRGWDKDAVMRATAVIDTVAVNELITANGNQYVPVGGIAHAGDRGISRVQVRVDNNDYADALLRTPISDTTWVIWRYDWPFQSGSHTFTVRCVDGDGNTQIETVEGVRPSGATGLHSVSANV
jgi:DMSO/TMAO reductase YedYZ molybdopterin-dependent catalytic subunit